MLKSYEAIYDHGRLQWLGEVPRFKRVRVVLVADDSDELKDNPIIQANGSQLVEIITAMPLEISASIAEKYGDAVVWQREQRQERPLPGREDV